MQDTWDYDYSMSYESESKPLIMSCLIFPSVQKPVSVVCRQSSTSINRKRKSARMTTCFDCGLAERRHNLLQGKCHRLAMTFSWVKYISRGSWFRRRQMWKSCQLSASNELCFGLWPNKVRSSLNPELSGSNRAFPSGWYSLQFIGIKYKHRRT